MPPKRGATKNTSTSIGSGETFKKSAIDRNEESKRRYEVRNQQTWAQTWLYSTRVVLVFIFAVLCLYIWAVIEEGTLIQKVEDIVKFLIDNVFGVIFGAVVAALFANRKRRR